MDFNFIKKLVKLVETSGITDLELEEEGKRIKIARKTRTYSSPPTDQNFQSYNVSASPSSETQKETPQEEKQTGDESSLHEIRSPIVGTFYRAPAPDADAYIQVGDSVTAGTVLCIVEAMKLMNEIESDIDGKVVKALVENGKPVEYNQPLFLVQPS